MIIHEFLPDLSQSPLHIDDIEPEKTAIVSVDMINGFCTQGPLASPRIQQLAMPVALFLNQAWKHGCRNIALLQDAHRQDDIEFQQFPPHCLDGSEEARTIPEIRNLPFFHDLRIFRKNALAADDSLNTPYGDWLRSNDWTFTYIVVGNCTDLCVYQTAMQLKMHFNRLGEPVRVIVPGNLVETYDSLNHPAELLNGVFKYHMSLNGIIVA